MTSPVDTSVKWARSDMPGAPILTRAAGSLISLLDALCVDGWGAQTATSVVVSGGFAEATFPLDHAAAPHTVVLVAGVTGAMGALNGEQKITSALPNKIRWATALADGTATGTIVIKMAAAGWAKPFSGTNLAVYKSASPEAHGQFLRVNDTNAQYARAVGYETMTTVSAGTGLFPSTAQVNGGYYWHKTTATAGSPPTPWAFASDGRTLYVFPQNYVWQDPAAYSSGGISFGDMVPEALAGDAFSTLIGGSVLVEPGYSTLHNMLRTGDDGSVATPRPYTGVGASQRGSFNASQFFNQSTIYPNPLTGAFTAAPRMYAGSASEAPRATVAGILLALEIEVQRSNIPPGTVLGGFGPQKAQLYIPSGTYIEYSSGLAAYLVDVTGPWR